MRKVSIPTTKKKITGGTKIQREKKSKPAGLDHRSHTQDLQIDQRLMELTSLFELSKLLNSSLDLREILNNILLVPMGRLMISKGIFLLNQKEKGFIIETLKGLPRDLIGQSVKIESIPLQPFFLNQVETSDWKIFFSGQGLEIVLPLISKNEPLGILAYGKKLNTPSYSKNEIEFLNSLSNISATAIENALVFTELKKSNTERDHKIQELNTLFDIGKELNSTLDSEKIIKLLTYALMGQILVNKFAILQRNEAGQMDIRTAKSMQFNREGDQNLEKYFSELFLISQPVFIKEIESIDLKNYLLQAGVMILVPMRLQDETKGIMALGEKITRQVYSPSEVEFLYTLANQAMISLENARLFQEEVEKQRLEEDLNIARRIQQQLLPKTFPELPGFEFYGVNVSSKQVGGDYFDVIQLDTTHIGVAIADVSGKGTPAALLMANIQASLRALTFENIPIPKMVFRINNLIHQNTETDKFITFFYGVIDIEKKTFIYCNAGHNPPYLIHSDGSYQVLDKGGVLLGIMAGLEYEEESIGLKSGDRIFMFTDGISEAMNVRDEEFEEKRIQEILLNSAAAGAKETVERMENAVREFTKGAPQSDDLTMVVVAVK